MQSQHFTKCTRWLLYLKSSPQIATPMERSDSSSKWVLVSSALALAALAALWLPGKGMFSPTPKIRSR
jgi:hypothetical protein